MRAVVISEHGSFDVLKIEERPVPEPGPGEVRVKVVAAALNHLDTWVRRGIPGFKFPLPITPGCDGAGVIDALGEGVEGAAVGDEVVLAPGIGHPMDRHYGILGETQDGTCCEQIVVPVENALPKPDNISWHEAACHSLTFLTAWGMLVTRAQEFRKALQGLPRKLASKVKGKDVREIQVMIDEEIARILANFVRRRGLEDLT